jgi:hypothetical protein
MTALTRSALGIALATTLCLTDAAQAQTLNFCSAKKKGCVS